MKLNRILESAILNEFGVAHELQPFNTINSRDIDELAEVLEITQKAAAPWLEEVSNGSLEQYLMGYPFFRGRKGESRTVFYKRIREDRKPVDSSRETHDYINDYLMDKGAVAHRGNSAFVTRSMANAGAYGSVYYIFPVGQYSYTWIKGMTDFTTMFNELLRNVSGDDVSKMGELDLTQSNDKKVWDEALKRIINLNMEGKIFINEGIDRVMNEEVMIHADGMIYIDQRVFDRNKIRRALDEIE